MLSNPAFLVMLALYVIIFGYHIHVHLKLIRLRRDWSRLRDQSVGFYNRPPWRKPTHFDKNQK